MEQFIHDNGLTIVSIFTSLVALATVMARTSNTRAKTDEKQVDVMQSLVTMFGGYLSDNTHELKIANQRAIGEQKLIQERIDKQDDMAKIEVAARTGMANKLQANTDATDRLIDEMRGVAPAIGNEIQTAMRQSVGGTKNNIDAAVKTLLEEIPEHVWDTLSAKEVLDRLRRKD